MKNVRIQTWPVVTMAVLLALMAGCDKKEPVSPPASPETQSAPAENPAPAAPAPAQLGQLAAKLDGLTWIKGQPVDFQPGKVYVVEFWATWCPPCRATIPHLTDIQKQYKDKGVTVIGVSGERDNLEKVKQFVTEQGEQMDYTVALDTEGTVNAGYMDAFGQKYIPAAFIVDGGGKVAWYGYPLELDAVLPQVIAGTFDSAAYAKAKAEREALEKQVGALAKEYVDAVQADKPVDQTRPIADRFIDIAGADVLNQVAWYLLTEMDAARRDYPTLLKMAEKANTLTEGKQAAILDTYALALFKNSKVAEAVAAQTKAVELAADNKTIQAELNTHLDEYEAALPK